MFYFSKNIVAAKCRRVPGGPLALGMKKSMAYCSMLCDTTGAPWPCLSPQTLELLHSLYMLPMCALPQVYNVCYPAVLHDVSTEYRLCEAEIRLG